MQTTTPKTTDPQDELLTQVDEDNQVIGPIKRGIAHQSPGIIYRTVIVLVKNEQNQVLVQKRSATKDLYANCWDLSVGGHVNYGQTYLETAIKELQEELALQVKAEDLKLKGEVLVNLASSKEFFQVFEYQLKVSDQISLAKEEVTTFKWMTLEEIKQSIKQRSLQWYARPQQIIKALY